MSFIINPYKVVPGFPTVTLASAQTSSIITLSNGNLTAGFASSPAVDGHAQANLARSTGKFYFEARVDAIDGSFPYDFGFGFAVLAGTTNSGIGTPNTIWYDERNSIMYDLSGGGHAAPSGKAVGDIFGCALDFSGTAQFFRNGTSIGSYATGVTTVYPIISMIAATGNQMTVRFKRSSMSSVPSGFLAWDGS